MANHLLFSLCLASMFPLPFPDRMYGFRFSLSCAFFCCVAFHHTVLQSTSSSYGVLIALVLGLSLRGSQALISFCGELLDCLQSNALGGQAVGVQTAGGKTPCSILCLYVHSAVLFQVPVVLHILSLMKELEKKITDAEMIVQSLLLVACECIGETLLIATPVLLGLIILLWTSATFSRFCRGMSLIAEISVVRISLFWILLGAAIQSNCLEQHFLASHIKKQLQHLLTNAISLQ